MERNEEDREPGAESGVAPSAPTQGPTPAGAPMLIRRATAIVVRPVREPEAEGRGGVL